MGGKVVVREEPKEIAQSNGHPIPSLFNSLGIANVKTGDQFTINYSGGIIEASVKRKSGKTETAMMHVKSAGGFSQLTTFDPDQMSKKERNELIKKLKNSGETQQKLGKKFGLSQTMISKIINSDD